MSTAVAYVQDIGASFSRHMEEHKGETLEEFGARHFQGDADSSAGVREVKFLDLIQKAAEEFNQEKDREMEAAGLSLSGIHRHHSRRHHPLKTRRDFEFQLSPEELDVLFREGTVISSKEFQDFGNAYRKLYSNDIPVYVSADSMLQAWHITFDLMLEELETEVLKPALTRVLHAMIDAVVGLDGVSDDIVGDVVHYLAVPCALMNGVGPDGLADMFSNKRIVDQFQRIAHTLNTVESKRPSPCRLFGPKSREVDFSQFVPRGHYTKTPELTEYFKGMMWLGRTEFELTQKTGHDIMAALILEQVVSENEEVNAMVEQVSALLTNFIGVPDSMTLGQLGNILKESGGSLSCFTYNHDRDSARFLGLLDEMDVGAQKINSQLREVEDGGIPRAATFLGQRFTLDAWAMCQTVYPNIPSGGVRRIPSSIDVAYSVFGNECAGSVASQRMVNGNEDRVPFRDGVDYLANLQSARRVVDDAPEEFWHASIYGMWIRALRCLSHPSPNPCGNFAMDGWKRKTMHAQLGSWAQLRHDTILYVKQGYTSMTCCEFPDALVEPQPLFWSSMMEMAERSCALIEEVGYPETGGTERRRWRGSVQDCHVQFLTRFSQTMGQLRVICDKQTNGDTLSAEDMEFLNRICVLHQTFGSGASRSWRGWYPELFYGGPDNVEQSPALVADVHTDPPSDHGNPGCIVHEGVGNVRLCYTIGMNGDGVETVYVGPVLMYYEHLAPYPERLDDDAWKLKLGTVKSPAWMKHLVVDH